MTSMKRALALLGLELVCKQGPHHIHIRHRGKVIAQWWPSGGKTMLGQRRGKLCMTGGRLVAWMRDLQARGEVPHGR